MSDKFKATFVDANGSPVEDTGETAGFGEGRHLCKAHAKIAQTERIIKSYRGTQNDARQLTNFDVAVGLALLLSDTIEAFRDMIENADIPASAKETLFNDGDVVVSQLGAALDAGVKVMIGATR